MKNLLMITLMLGFSISLSFGQCEIYLKKQGEYDWVKNYNDLVKIYSSKKEEITSLQGYFYQNGKVKTCISLDSLKFLQNDLEKVFATTQKPVKIVGELKVAITTIILKNPNGISVEKKPDSAESTIAVATTPPSNDLELEQFAEKIIKLEKDKNLWFYISIASLLGLVGLLIFYLFDRKKFIEQLALKDKTFLESQGNNFDSGRNGIEIWREKYKNLQKEKDNLEKEYRDFKENSSKSDIEKPIEKIHDFSETLTKEPLKQFYLSIPTPTDDGLGIFRDMRQPQANPTSSFYRFELERDENKAKFWFLDNSNTIQSAVIYPETYINPVCDYEGFNSNAKRIITKEPGIAIKEGDVWKVRTKAKIRFE
jgi:hypothetical protein